MRSLDEDRGAVGEVRRFASGQRRAVVGRGHVPSFGAQAVMVTRATYERLRGWVGELVLWRDPGGRRVFGMLGAVSAGDQAGIDTARVASVAVRIDPTSDSDAV